MQVRGVDFVLLSVSDVERSLEFYRDTLGLRLDSSSPPSWYEFDAGNVTSAIGKPPEGAPQPPYQGGITVALAVPNTQEALAELKAKGVQVIYEVWEASTCFMALISDPDGNGLWIHQRKDGTAG